MDGGWSCYGGGQFNEGRMVVIEAASNGGGMVMLEVACLMEEEWSCYRGGQFHGGRMVMLQRTVQWSENGCYKGNLFNRGRVVMLRRWPV